MPFHHVLDGMLSDFDAGELRCPDLTCRAALMRDESTRVEYVVIGSERMPVWVETTCQATTDACGARIQVRLPLPK